MKKLLLVIVASFCLTTIFAQPYFQKGSWLAGGKGSLKFGSQDLGDDDKYHESSFRLSPDVGYFFCTAFAVGLALEYEHFSDHINDDDPLKSNTIAAGLLLRYYFFKNALKHNLFAHAAYNVGGFKYSDQDRVNFNAFVLGVSYVCFLTTHVGLELGLEYRSSHDEGDPEDYGRFNRFGLCAGLQFYLDPCGRKRVAEVR